MRSPITNRVLQNSRSDLDDLLHQVQQLAADINNPNLQTTTHSLRKNINEPFLFTVVSEKEKFKDDVTARLNQKLSLIYEEVERIFVQFYDYVEREEEAIAPVLTQYQTIQNSAQQLFSQGDQLK